MDPREIFLRRGNWRRFSAEDGIGGQIRNCRTNSRSMDGLNYGVVVSLIYYAVGEMWLKERLKLRLKGSFHGPRAGRERHHSIRRMRISRGAGEELGTEHSQVIIDKSKLTFLMEMRD